MTNVYIASLPRSGSTLLGLILDQHDKCFHAGESHYWKKFDPELTVCSCGVIGCQLLKQVYSEIREDMAVLSIHDACKTLDEWPIRNFGLALTDREIALIENGHLGLNKVCDVFRKLTLSPIIIDKSTNIRIAEALAKDDKWKIILLTRDPRGIAYSRRKSAIRHNQEIEKNLGIPVFTDFLRITSSFLGQSNVLHVKYEDICRNTVSQIERICDFLSIEFNQEILKFRKKKGHTVMGNRMRFRADDIIAEDLEWQIGLSGCEQRSILKNKELRIGYEKLGYNFD